MIHQPPRHGVVEFKHIFPVVHSSVVSAISVVNNSRWSGTLPAR